MPAYIALIVCRLDVDDFLFGGMVAEAQQTHELGDVAYMDLEAEGMFGRYCQTSRLEMPLEMPSLVPDMVPDDGEDVGGSSTGDDDGEDMGGTASGGDVAMWQSNVISASKRRTWTEYTSGRFRSRCFAVEWRGSVLTDRMEFVRRMCGVIGGDAPFMLGTEVRSSRADYFVVVRSRKLLCWRDWRKKLMFGHGDDADEAGLFMSVRVPSATSAEGLKAFVDDMTRKCDAYEHTSKHLEADLVRDHDKSYPRPGRRKGGVVG